MYEGHDWDTVTLLARLVVGWEIPNFIITNAAGGLNPDFNVGDLMVIESFRDHLNPNHKETGLLQALAQKPIESINSLTKKVLELGQGLSKEDNQFRPLKKGCYAALLGPSYETFAEVEMLRRLNADAVGMSTVPEVILGRFLGLKCGAVSVITNFGAGMTGAELSHQETKEMAPVGGKRLQAILTRAIVELE